MNDHFETFFTEFRIDLKEESQIEYFASRQFLPFVRLLFIQIQLRKEY